MNPIERFKELGLNNLIERYKELEEFKKEYSLYSKEGSNPEIEPLNDKKPLTKKDVLSKFLGKN